MYIRSQIKSHNNYKCYNYNNYYAVHIMYVHMYNFYPVVTIITPPQNTTVCRGSDVTISCGYQWATALPVTWIINGTSFTQDQIVNSPLYQLNNPLNPKFTSLTVFSINGTTTFQCIVLYQLATSTRGTVTLIKYGM